MCQCLTNFLIKITCAIQLFLIQYPNCITNAILSFFYLIDLLIYSSFGAKEFLIKRSELIGPNFPSLGKIIVGDYVQVAEIIQSPQQRGFYLGRARLLPSKIPKSFLLFLSDQEAGGNDLHSVLHDDIWENVMPIAMKRLSDPAFSRYISEAVEKTRTIPKDTKTFSKEIQKMVVRYVFHAIFGFALNDEQVDIFYELFFSNSPSSDYITGAVKPFGRFVTCCQGKRSKNIDKVMQIILLSPLMSDYAPSERNAYRTREEYAENLLAVTGIAGCVGTSALCLQVFLAIPGDFPINLSDHRELMLAVLEAARVRSPVNNINVILKRDMDFLIGKKKIKFSPGTVVAASIGLASTDPAVFSNPNTYDPKRENLLKATLNFNHVGFNSVGSGKRQCPGRNLAMKLASDLLIEIRHKESKAYRPPTTRD